MRTTFQVISALAAVVGIVFLLSATPHPLGGTSTASSSSTASSGAAAEAPGSSASTGQKSFHALATSDAIVTPANQSTENLATPAESNPKPISPSPPPANKPRIVPAHAEPPATTSLNLNQPEWRVVIGIALLCLGFIGLIVLSLQHRRLNATGT